MVKLLKLVLIVLLIKTSTAKIESLNALLRRMLSSRCQTHTMDFVELCGRFLTGRVRVRGKMIKTPSSISGAGVKRQVRKDKLKRNRTNKKRPGKGGSWMMYMRKRQRGIARISWKVCAEEYKNLPPEELGELTKTWNGCDGGRADWWKEGALS